MLSAYFWQGAPGFEVDLGPGDVLFIPHHWWHYVETTAGDPAVDGLALSMNLWFDFEPRLTAPRRPLSGGLLLELARHIEALLGSLVMAPCEIPAFLSSCATELAATHDKAAAAVADADNETSLPRMWLVARNMLFCELATSWIGWAGLRPFFDTLLYADRFRDLTPAAGPANARG